MTGDEVKDRIIDIIKQRLELSDLELALKDLKSASGVSLKTLREQFSRMSEGAIDLGWVPPPPLNPLLAQITAQGWFILVHGGRVWCARLKHDKLNGHSTRKLDLMPPSPDFRVLMQRLQPDAPAEHSPGVLWMKSPETTCYDGVTIDPTCPTMMTAEGRLNLWMGFDVLPEADEARAAMFRAHVLRLCSGDAAIAGYLLDWIAFGFQHPGKPIGVAPILIGEPGTGKGMLGNLIASIWGPHGLVLRDKRSIMGDFNAHLAQCGFAFIDEALFVGDRSISDRMKGLITEPTLMIEDKFKSRVEMTNMLKLIMATNHDHAIHIDPQDRRYVVVRVPDDMPGSGAPYWEEFGAACHGREGRAAILADMLARDVSTFHAERDRPATEAMTEQKLASLTGDLLYWRHVAGEGTLTPGETTQALPDTPSTTRAGEVDKNKLYGFYTAFHWKHLRTTPVPYGTFYKTALKFGIVRDSVRRTVEGDRPWFAQVESFAEIDRRLTDSLSRPRVSDQPQAGKSPTSPT